jgi:hypothetical protein
MSKVSIDLVKEEFVKTQFDKVVDTQFTQLLPQTTTPAPEPTVNDLFTLYNRLFYEIPPTGNNSHTTLIERSSEFINYKDQDKTIEALLEEINSLQGQINTLIQENIKLQVTPLTNG